MNRRIAKKVLRTPEGRNSRQIIQAAKRLRPGWWPPTLVRLGIPALFGPWRRLEHFASSSAVCAEVDRVGIAQIWRRSAWVRRLPDGHTRWYDRAVAFGGIELQEADD